MDIYGREVYETLDAMIAPQHTALVIVDMQHDYISPGGSCQLGAFDFSNMLPKLKAVIEEARSCCKLVIYIQQTQLPGLVNESPSWMHILYHHLGQSPEVERCRLNTWGGEIIPEISPAPGDLVIRKYRASAFVGTNLDLVLRSNRIETIVVTGLATEGCVFATALFGTYHDYYVVLVEDCVASGNQDHHDAALQYLSTWLNAVSSSDEILKIWRGAST